VQIIGVLGNQFVGIDIAGGGTGNGDVPTIGTGLEQIGDALGARAGALVDRLVGQRSIARLEINARWLDGRISCFREGSDQAWLLGRVPCRPDADTVSDRHRRGRYPGRTRSGALRPASGRRGRRASGRPGGRPGGRPRATSSSSPSRALNPGGGRSLPSGGVGNMSTDPARRGRPPLPRLHQGPER